MPELKYTGEDLEIDNLYKEGSVPLTAAVGFKTAACVGVCVCASIVFSAVVLI